MTISFSKAGAETAPALAPSFTARDSAYLLLLVTAANATNYMDRMVLSALATDLRAPIADGGLGLTDTEYGVLSGFAFVLLYAIAGLPLARLADWGNRRILLGASIFGWSLMTALCGAASNFFTMLLARIGVGVGEAGCIPTCQSLLADANPVEKRSFANAIFASGAAIGIFLGFTVGGLVGASFGWQAAFVAVALPGLVLALVVLLTMPMPPRGGVGAAAPPGVKQAAPEKPRPVSQVITGLARTSSYKWIVAAFVLNGFASYGAVAWVPAFFEDTHDFKQAALATFGFDASGPLFGIAFGMGIGIGAVIGGYLVQRMAGSDLGRALRICALIVTASLPLALLALFLPGAWTSYFMLCVYVIVAGAVQGPIFAALTSVVRPNERAVAIALMMFIGSVAGIGGGPLVIGALSDLFHALGAVHSLRYALLGAVVAAGSVVVWLMLAARTANADMMLAEGRRPVSADAFV